MMNLALAYDAQKNWKSEQETYQNLLRHAPGTVAWQSKIKELQQKLGSEIAYPRCKSSAEPIKQLL
jgi:hypothetical protein